MNTGHIPRLFVSLFAFKLGKTVLFIANGSSSRLLVRMAEWMFWGLILKNLTKKF